MLRLVPLHDVRPHLGFRELAHGAAQQLLLFGRAKVHGTRLSRKAEPWHNGDGRGADAHRAACGRLRLLTTACRCLLVSLLLACPAGRARRPHRLPRRHDRPRRTVPRRASRSAPGLRDCRLRVRVRAHQRRTRVEARAGAADVHVQRSAADADSDRRNAVLRDRRRRRLSRDALDRAGTRSETNFGTNVGGGARSRSPGRSGCGSTTGVHA